MVNIRTPEKFLSDPFVMRYSKDLGSIKVGRRAQATQLLRLHDRTKTASILLQISNLFVRSRVHTLLPLDTFDRYVMLPSTMPPSQYLHRPSVNLVYIYSPLSIAHLHGRCIVCKVVFWQVYLRWIFSCNWCTRLVAMGLGRT